MKNVLDFRVGIYPAVDPLDSTSRILDPNIVGAEHYNIARGVQKILQVRQFNWIYGGCDKILIHRHEAENDDVVWSLGDEQSMISKANADQPWHYILYSLIKSTRYF